MIMSRLLQELIAMHHDYISKSTIIIITATTIVQSYSESVSHFFAPPLQACANMINCLLWQHIDNASILH